jgi:serine/threonine protein kinase
VTPRVLAGRFELRRELGRGGMATVWSAHDRTLDRMVAVKVLRDDLSEEHADRIQREARAAARIDDPRVVKVLDLEHDADGTPFLVLEELEGRTLADELREGPLAAARAGRLAEDLLGGLAAAHERGVLHRDVKPTNVLAAGDGFRITDFGIASLDDEATTGALMGTLVYVAPERFDGAPATPRSDVFSAAAVLYEALSGHQPFRGSNPADSLERLRSGRFDPLPDHVPAALERAITMALDPDPAQRPADAGAFARLAGGVADPVTDTLVGSPDQGDITERLDHVLRVPAPAGDPALAADDRTVVIDRPQEAAPVAPPPAPRTPLPAPRTPLREDPRVERLAEVARRPQTIFVALGVLLLIAVLVAAASAGGDGDARNPVTDGGEPAEQIEQQLDRIEELGR